MVHCPGRAPYRTGVADTLETRSSVTWFTTPNLVILCQTTQKHSAKLSGRVSCFLTFDLLTLKVVSESSVTYVGYLCAYFSLPIGLSVLDLGRCTRHTDYRQTDRQTSDKSIA